jgi:hypothetical protein
LVLASKNHKEYRRGALLRRSAAAAPRLPLRSDARLFARLRLQASRRPGAQSGGGHAWGREEKPIDEAELLFSRRHAAEVQQHRRRVERRLLRMQAELETASRRVKDASSLGSWP